MTTFHSGFAAIIGRPNVGKSTLLNALIGEKISIMSSKPQTTRNKIKGIVTGGNYQIILIDTPGMHQPQTKLGGYMQKAAEQAMNDVDLIVLVTEPWINAKNGIPRGDEIIIERLHRVKTPVFLVINKIDTVEKPVLLTVTDVYHKRFPFAEIISVSALKAENTNDLLGLAADAMPEGPMFFPNNMITDQPEKQIAAEMIREKALRFLREEVPHGVAVEITAMTKRENRELVDVQATLYCEKDSHKGILIGKGGAMLKKIGAAARIDIQRMLGSPINLELWTRVKKDWRESDFYLKNFGYDSKQM